MGVLSIFGANTVTWNGAQIIGLAGLFTSILIGMFLVLFSTLVLGTGCIFGTWLFSKFESIGITYFPAAARAPSNEAHQEVGAGEA